MATSETPIRVRLTRLADVAPAGLEGDDFLAWLCAPIAGEPLYKRTLQVLLSLRIHELVLEPGPVSEAVLALFEDRPIYNLRARMAPTAQAVSPEHAATLVVPVGGLLEADLAGLQSRGERSERLERTPVSLPSQDGRRVEIVYLPPGHSAAEIDETTPATDDYTPAPPILRPTGSSVALREVAQRALEGDLAAFAPIGTWHDDLLVGEGAEVARSVRVIGKAAVGAGSVVEDDMILGHGAMIGEGCTVGRGARLTHAMVLDGSRVPAGASLLGLVHVPSGRDI